MCVALETFISIWSNRQLSIRHTHSHTHTYMDFNTLRNITKMLPHFEVFEINAPALPCPAAVATPFGHVNLNVCSAGRAQPTAESPSLSLSLDKWGQVCICRSSAQGVPATVAPSLPPVRLPANWAGSSGGQKKTINCVAQKKRGKKERKASESKKQRTAEIYLKGVQGGELLERERERKCAGNQYATKAICQMATPQRPRCTELNWAELRRRLSWVYGGAHK